MFLFCVPGYSLKIEKTLLRSCKIGQDLSLDLVVQNMYFEIPSKRIVHCLHYSENHIFEILAGIYRIYVILNLWMTRKQVKQVQIVPNVEMNK